MAKTEEFSCPNCGAPLTVRGEGATMACPFCGTSVIIPEALRLRPAPPPPPPLPAQPAFAPTYARERRPVRRRRSNLGGLGCGLVLVLFACGLSAAARQPWARPLVAELAILAGEPTPVPPRSVPLSAGLPRSLRYAGIEYTVTEAGMDNAETYGSQTEYRAGQLYARLAVRMKNTTTSEVYPDGSLFKLRLANGKDYANDSYNLSPPSPGGTSESTLVFTVPPNAQWDGAVLVLAGGDKEPAELPLTGAVPVPAYPQDLSLPQPAEVDSPAGDLRYTLLSARLDLDYAGTRVPAGKRFLVLGLRLTNTGGEYGIAMSGGYFRLVVDGVPLAPESAPIELLEYKAALDGDVVFAVPANAQRAELQLGEVTGDADKIATLALDLGGP